MKKLALVIALVATIVHAQAPAFDAIIRHGTILDGTGNPLFVAPGFINIHSHASPDALPTAVNMLTQGVTTDIFNADGNGPLDLNQQTATLSAAGLALNIGGYIGFNAVWQSVVGNTDRRPGPGEIDRMRVLIREGLAQGAWGVSAGLDYKPGYFARTEADLITILQDPVTSMACDCGATTATRMHPRFYGSYPRVLGRYVREQTIMSWEQAIRKSSALPAATIGMIDRGLLAVGMAADITVFDPNTVIDRATYENPALPSEGIRRVLVNGKVALRDGAATGTQAGRALIRTANMPSRPTTEAIARRVTARGPASGMRIALDVSHRPGAREASGTFTLEDSQATTSIRLTAPGVLQVHKDWASFTGRASTGTGDERAVAVIVDRADPASPGTATVVVSLDGSRPWRGTLPSNAVSFRQ